MTAERDEFRTTALKSTLVAVAWLNARAAEGGVRLPPRKLQILLYIAQALYAAANGGRPLLPSVFVASAMGPVDPNLYDILERCDDLRAKGGIEPRAEACLGLVWRRYGQATADDLDAFVADDGVFASALDASAGSIIPLPLLAETYRRRMIDPAVAARAGTDVAADLPAGIPATTADGRAIRRWTPGRRVY